MSCKKVSGRYIYLFYSQGYKKKEYIASLGKCFNDISMTWVIALHIVFGLVMLTNKSLDRKVYLENLYNRKAI